MKLHLKLLTGLGLLSFLLPGPAFAQYYPGSVGSSYQRNPGIPFQRPAVSPYLNLFNGGTNPAINYFGIIRPQIEFRNSLLQMQQQIAMGEQSTSDLATTLGMVTTGHPSFFMSHRKYFQNVGTGAAGAQMRGGRSQLQNPMLSQMGRPGSLRGMGSMGSMGSMRRGY
jgi:hypothetical protein